MKGFCFTDVFTAFINFIPLIIGASAQSYVVTKNLKNTLYTLVAFLFAGVVGIVVAYLDSDINSVSDVNNVFIIMAMISFSVYAEIFSTKIILPLNAPISLVYVAIFWIIMSDFLSHYGNYNIINILVVYPSIFVTLVAILLSIFKNFPLRRQGEILIYSWVSIFLIVVAIFSFKEVSSGFPDSVILTRFGMSVISLFFTGALFFQGTMLAMGVLLMLPIFKDKKERIHVELERARVHRSNVVLSFMDTVFTAKSTLAYLALVSIILLLKYGFHIGNELLIYFGVSLSDRLFMHKPVS